VSEGGTMPATVKPTFVELTDDPKTIVHGFKVTELMEFMSSVDDAIDLLPVLREEFGKEHARAINAMLLDDVTDLASDNFESLDRVISSDSDETNNADTDDPDIYGLDRSAGGWDNAYTNDAAANRDLTLTLIDTTLQNIWDAGGKPKVIMTGTDTLMRWQQLLEAERRFMETARVVPTFGGVRGLAPGVEAGFMVATYFGIPIITSQDAPSDTISHIHFYDTDFLELRIAKPTVYYESARNQGFIYMDYLGMEGYYQTMGELICTRFNVQGKLVNLK